MRIYAFQHVTVARAQSTTLLAAESCGGALRPVAACSSVGVPVVGVRQPSGVRFIHMGHPYQGAFSRSWRYPKCQSMSWVSPCRCGVLAVLAVSRPFRHCSRPCAAARQRRPRRRIGTPPGAQDISMSGRTRPDRHLCMATARGRSPTPLPARPVRRRARGDAQDFRHR